MSKFLTSHLGAFIYDPTKEFVGFYVVSKINSSSFGPRATLTMIFKKKGIPIVSFKGNFNNFIASDFAIVDITGKAECKEALKKEIREKFGKRLISLECMQTDIPGMIYNPYEWPLTVSVGRTEVRATALSSHGWRSLFQTLYKKWGKEGLEIYELFGKELGEVRGRIINEQMPKLGVKEKLNSMLLCAQMQGWGRFTISVRGGIIKVKVYENFECAVTKGIQGYDSSFMKGFLTGILSELLGIACSCLEIRCINDGNDFCEFVIAPFIANAESINGTWNVSK